MASPKKVRTSQLRSGDRIRVVLRERRISDGRYRFVAASNKRDSVPAVVLTVKREPTATVVPGCPWVVLVQLTQQSGFAMGYFNGGHVQWPVT